jgi:hypothetical protein
MKFWDALADLVAYRHDGQPGDSLDDLFPGSSAIGRTWAADAYRATLAW